MARRNRARSSTRWLSLVNSDVHPHFKAFFGGADYLEDPALIEKAQEQARKNCVRCTSGSMRNWKERIG